MNNDAQYLENLDNLEMMITIARNDVADEHEINPHSSERSWLHGAHTHLQHAIHCLKEAHALRMEKVEHLKNNTPSDRDG